MTTESKPTPNYNTNIPPGILTPDKVGTSIGTLEFRDGAPLPETAQKVYDFLDTMRGVDAFLKGIPGASLRGLIKGAQSLGAVECHQVVITDKLMDSNSLYLTANTSTMYVALTSASGPKRRRVTRITGSKPSPARVGAWPFGFKARSSHGSRRAGGRVKSSK